MIVFIDLMWLLNPVLKIYFLDYWIKAKPMTMVIVLDFLYLLEID